MKQSYIFLFISILIGGLTLSRAQLAVTTGSPYSQYVTALGGPGIEILSIDSIFCDTIGNPPTLPQMGGYDAANTTTGLTDGLLLTSGSLTNVLPGGASGTSLQGPGDAKLDSIIAPDFTNDACGVIIDLIPSCDTIIIRYAFGSNEYPTFVGAFNDVGVILVSGPGYTPFTNVALVPGTNLFVSVNNVNAATNSAFFDATGGNSGYNGITVVLEAVIPVQRCQEYQLYFAVADEQDQAFDSGLFIEPFTCGSPTPKVIARNVNNPNSPYATEDCVDGIFTFFKVGDVNQPATYNLTFQGTATNGVDYLMPSIVTIPPGDDSIDVPVVIFNDGIAEGEETLKLGLDVFTCDSAVMFIKDPFEVEAGNDTSLCSFLAHPIGPSPDSGTTYTWDFAFGTIGSLNVTPLQVGINSQSATINQTYYVNAIDESGCTARDSVNVTFLPGPPSDFFADNGVCAGDFANIVYSQPTLPNYTYNWDFGNTNLVSGTGPGPYLVSWNNPGFQTVKLVVNDGFCDSDTTERVVEIFAAPSSDFQLPATACQGEAVFLNYLGGANPANATFTWDFGGGITTPAGATFPITWNTPGIKTVKLTVEANGCESFETIRTINVIPTPDGSFFLQDTMCLDEITQITYTGANGSGALYNWSFDAGQILSGVGAGPYQIQWQLPGEKTVCLQVDDQGCAAPNNCQTIFVSAEPSVGIAPVVNQCFTGNIFDFVPTGDSSATYFWDFGDGAIPQISSAEVPPSVSYNSPGIKTVKLVSTSAGCVSDTAEISFEVVPEPSTDFQLSANKACLNEAVNISYTGTVLGPTQSFFWEFGANAIPATSTQQNPPSVSYTSSGMKEVKLTVNYKGCEVSEIKTVEVNAGPVVTAGANKEFCEGDGGVQLDASVFTGTAPYFYSWSCQNGTSCGLDSVNVEDPIANPTTTQPNQSITYYFQVTDVNGCKSTVDSVEVLVKAKPRLNAGPNLSICPPDAEGDELQGSLAVNNNAPLPIAYTWTPATGLSDPNSLMPTARPDTTTIYTLTGVSANGCSSQATTVDPQATATVEVRPSPVVEAGLDTGICVNESIQLNGFASGAGPNYEYVWTPALPGTIDDANSPTPVVTPGATTVFTLVVTSEGCSGADSVRVQVDTKPTVEAGDNRDICQGEIFNLDGKADGDPNASDYNYSWTPGTGLSDSSIATPDASPLDTITYTVIATTDFGCASEPDQITLFVLPTPQVDLLQGDTILCEGDELELTAIHTFIDTEVPTAYEWTPVGKFVLTDEDSIAIGQALSTGFLQVQASSFGGKCVTTDEILVEVNPAVRASIEADTNQICQDSELLMQAIGGQGSASYQWLPAEAFDNPAAQTALASPENDTLIQVVITEGVCSDTASFDLEVSRTPIADYFSSIAEGCGELTVNFQNNTTNATSYIWDFGDGSPLSNEPNPVHTYTEAGVYPVSFTTVGEKGCANTSQSVTVVISPIPNASFDSDPPLGAKIPLPAATVQFIDQSTDASSWFWEFGDGNVSQEPSPVHIYTRPGLYTVSLTITDANGCTNKVAFGTYEVFEPSLFIPTVFTPNGDGMNDRFEVQYDGNDDFQLAVYDRWGREVFFSEGAADTWDGRTAEGRDLKPGVYFYSLTIGEENYKGNVTLMR